jgi:Tfp pilus assembly protein PilN
MSNGRYSSTGSKSSSEAELAEIRTQLKNQGAAIDSLVKKIDALTKNVTAMSVQMTHLVTKESCSEGRAALAQDLKSRMDSSRDITGVDLPLKDIVRHYVKQDKPTPIPRKKSSSDSHPRPLFEKKDRGFTFWVSLISGLLAIIAFTYGGSSFVDRMIQRQERTDQILLQLQEKMTEKAGAAPRKQSLSKNDASR